MPPDRPRNQHGQYQAEIDDTDILDAVGEHDPATTAEVAEAVGFEQRSSAQYRLNKLEREGRVRSKKAGQTLVWMLDGD